MKFRIPVRLIEDIDLMKVDGTNIDVENILSLKDGEPIIASFCLTKSLIKYSIENNIELTYDQELKFIENDEIKNLASKFNDKLSKTNDKSKDSPVGLMLRISGIIASKKISNICKEQYPLYVECTSEKFTMMVMTL